MHVAGLPASVAPLIIHLGPGREHVRPAERLPNCKDENAVSPHVSDDVVSLVLGNATAQRKKKRQVFNAT